MSKATKIVLVGNYGAGNLGDDAILAGISSLALEKNPKLKLSLLKGKHTTSEELYSKFESAPLYPSGIRSSLNWKGRQATQKLISESDLVLIGGGGLFIDTEASRAPYIWYRQSLAAKRAGKRYAFIGVSIGPVHSKLNEKFTLRALKGAEWIHVRDEASLKWLKAHKIRNCSLGTDFALHWLQVKMDQELEKESIQIKNSQNPKECLIVLRDWPDTKLSRRFILESIEAQCKLANYKPVLIAMDLSREEELQWMEESSIDLELHKSIHSLAERLKTASAALMMRLHANIFSLAFSVPTLSLSYGSKVNSFLKSVNSQQGRILDMTKASEKDFKQGLNNFFDALERGKSVRTQNQLLGADELLLKNQVVLTALLSEQGASSLELSG